MTISISSWVRITRQSVIKDGDSLLPAVAAIDSNMPDEVYRSFNYNYPKYFKMDLVCKWAWLGAEMLLTGNGSTVYEDIDKTKIAVLLSTSHGCLDVDKKYQETLATIPSPGLFVYTLPNIMLGELSIRHGFKGEQANLMMDGFDAAELNFWAQDLLHNRGMAACICGWVNAIDGQHDVCLFWITKDDKRQPLSEGLLQQLYNSKA